MDSEGPSFGALLREARLAKGLSQEELAERARVSVDAISALERGKRKTPQRQTLELLLEALDVGADMRAQFESAAARSSPTGPGLREDPLTARAGRSAGLGNVAHALTTFFGREVELATLASLAQTYRLVTITGAGGVGKTRTALELSFQIAQRFRDGIWFVELGPLRDAALVPKAIATALGIAEQGDVPLLELVAGRLKYQSLLIVLDNCEHLIDAAALAAHTILTRCPNVTIVASSREALRIEGEVAYRLPKLEVPPVSSQLTVESVLRYSAIALFVERSRSRTREFALTSQNVAAAAEICRRLDGIPLAIELAAAKTAVLSLPQIVERLNERFALLTDGSRLSLPRQQTLHALIEWSFDLLTSTEKIVFARLAVFSGAFSLAAAEAVVAFGPITRANVLRLISLLVEKSLVAVDPMSQDGARFRLLETTREYAQTKLQAAGEFDITLANATAYVLTFVRNARRALAHTPDTPWLDSVERELEHIRAALGWSLRDEHDIAAGAEICAMIGFYWDSRSWDEGTRWLVAARAKLDRLDQRLAALVLQESVRIQPTSDETFELAKRSLAAYREIDDVMGIASALEYVGQTLINLGRYGEAVTALEEGVEVARNAGDVVANFRMLVLLAFAHLYSEDVAAANERRSTAAAIAGPTTRVRDLGLLLRVDAEIALATGNAQTAVTIAQQALELAQTGSDLRGIGMGHYLLAHALAVSGSRSAARDHAVAAIETLSDAQIPFALAEAFLVAAAVAEGLTSDERASRLIGFALARAANIAFRSAFLIAGFVERSAAALRDRLGETRFEQLCDEGKRIDDDVFLVELRQEGQAFMPNFQDCGGR